MEIPWPLNTTFRILSPEDGDENWVVSTNSDPRNNIISNETALGKALILSNEIGKCSYITPEKKEMVLFILGIKPPETDWDIFKSPIEYYLAMFCMDPTGIRHNHFMADICLECGHPNPPTLPGVRTCEECGTTWHTTHCWNCGSEVDSRDTKTPLCSRRCGGCICANCGRCFCDTNFLWKHDDDD